MWARAIATVALRGLGKPLLLASATGWMALTWLLTGDRALHAHGSDHFTVMWMVMILAMAPPLLLREIGHLWRTSLRRLRQVTIVSFLAGYVGVWVVAGVPAALLAGWWSARPESLALAIALVAIWHCSPVHQRCLNACHRVPPLRVFGIAGQWDSLRYGLSTGSYCVATCGLIMVVVLLATNHHLAGMAVAAVVATFERHRPAKRPGWRLPLVPDRSPEWPGYCAS